MAVPFTLSEIMDKAKKVEIEELALAEFEQELSTTKLRLAATKEGLEELEAELTLKALESGEIDGKNAEMRKLQIGQTLLRNDDRLARRCAVSNLEEERVRLEQEVADAKASKRLAQNQLAIALAWLQQEGRTTINVIGS